MEDKVILPDSPEAAKLVTITGWMSRRGNFFGDKEHDARHNGATHIPCRYCSKPVSRGWVACSSCRDNISAEKYELLEKKPWDGESPVYSDAYDEYYNDLDSLDEGVDLSEYRFLICKPVYFPYLDESYFGQCLPEDMDGDLPKELLDLIKDFNEKLELINKTPVSYEPSKFALDLESIHEQQL